MGIKNSIEIDALPDNERSGRKEKIVTEIEQLKKEQKKVQMRFKLHHLRKHTAQEFVEDVFEQESYLQKLVLKRAKKVRNPNMYLGKSQCALDKFISQVDLVFQTKPLTYASKKVKCFYTTAFLSGILQRE